MTISNYKKASIGAFIDKTQYVCSRLDLIRYLF